MQFKDFNNKLKAQFNKMCATGKLFRSSITGQQVWDTYLSSFKPEDNGVFRDVNSSEHNCNCCKNFIKRYGNVVAIIDGELQTIFSTLHNCEEYQHSIIECDNLLINSTIQDVFFETYQMLDHGLNYEKTNKNQDTFKLGIGKTYCQYTKESEDKFGHKNSDGSYRVDFNKVYTFNHFELDLPKQFVDFSGKSVEQIMATYRDKYSVFKRAMEEIPLDTLLLVRDLINQGSLLDGTSHLHAVNNMIQHHQLFKMYERPITDLDYWTISYTLSETEAKFKNHLIGVLCTELAEGKELNEAVLSWNKRVDPANYHKAVAPITQAQINLAKKFVEENGYTESFNRRLATIDDVKASEILHINRDNSKVKAISMFDNIKTPSGNGQHKRSEFDKVEEVSIDKFMSDILPTCTNVELFLENRMEGNLVNLTTIVDKEAKQIFKWNNPFSYTFNGNLAGKSQLAQMVEAKGGRLDGVLRCTHSWNRLEPNQSLMDAHVFMPGTQYKDSFSKHFTVNGRYVGWNNRKDNLSGGNQDVDYVSAAPKGYVPIENITFPDITKMPEGTYTYRIHNWSFRQTGGRGEAEIAFEGNVYQYEYPATKQDEWITVAEIILKNGKFTINHILPLKNEQSKQLWNINTNQFHKVNLVCLTPNHWDTQIGNKHYLFFLQGCKNPNKVRGFHNEHLIPELLQHRKVLDVLGNTVLCEPTDNQLAGVGFNTTVKDEVILRLSGSFKRVIKVKF